MGSDTFGALDALMNSAGITGGCGTTWNLSPQVYRQRATMSRQQVEHLFARVPMRRLLLPTKPLR